MQVSSATPPMKAQPPVPAATDNAQLFEQVFDVTDKNGDGAASLQEFNDLLHYAQGQATGEITGIDPEVVEFVFNEVDTSGDGSISQSEMDVFLEQALGEQPQASSTSAHTQPTALAANDNAQLYDQVFNVTDEDGDGAASLKEFNDLLHYAQGQATGEITGIDPAVVESVFNDVDTSGDGSISRNEMDGFLDKILGAQPQPQAPMQVQSGPAVCPLAPTIENRPISGELV